MFTSNWPYPDLPRVFGVREAVAREERHQAARHVRASRREVRRDIIREVTSPANVRAVRETERDRDLWALAAAAGVLA